MFSRLASPGWEQVTAVVWCCGAASQCPLPSRANWDVFGKEAGGVAGGAGATEQYSRNANRQCELWGIGVEWGVWQRLCPMVCAEGLQREDTG